MTFSATQSFAAKPIVTWEVGQPVADPAQSVTRLSVNPYDDDLAFDAYFATFMEAATEHLPHMDSLVIGVWGESYEVNSSLPIGLLCQQSERFPALRSLFIGDMSLEECEVSWIQQSDISPLYSAFPKLEYLKVRGGEHLSLGTVLHNRLQKLVIESGGMDSEVLEQAHLANIPELTHLELWLGDENYGCTIGPDDIAAFLNGLGHQFPKLTYLGLRNYYLSDDLAATIAKTELPASLITLDLSNGNLSDAGAEALLASDKLSQLTTLDLHYHFMSDEMMAKLRAADNLPTLNLDDQNEAEVYDDKVYRYIFVSE